MEAIYNQDGTIRKVYDETQRNHAGLTTVRLTDAQTASQSSTPYQAISENTFTGRHRNSSTPFLPD